MYIFCILGIVVAFLLDKVLIQSSITLFALFDVPSLVMIFFISVGSMLSGGQIRNFTNALKIAFFKKIQATVDEMEKAKYAVKFFMLSVFCAAGFSLVFSAIAILMDLSEKTNLGMKLALALCSIMYSCILNLLALPIISRIEKRIQKSKES